MNTKFNTSFLVLPDHTNHHLPLIFGGKFFAELDIAAYSCVRQLLYYTDCDNAVTYKFNGEFHKPSYMGDIIYIETEITEMRHKTISVHVMAWREPAPTENINCPEKILVASADFVFVTMRNGQYVNHGLNLPIENLD
jgi:acyl-CoA hydrolase